MGRLFDRGAVHEIHLPETPATPRSTCSIDMARRPSVRSRARTVLSMPIGTGPSSSSLTSPSGWRTRAQFADLILPVCTALERDDIAEWANPGGYMPHAQTQVNHRMVMMLHKCIEPLGESKSDYQIFLEVLDEAARLRRHVLGRWLRRTELRASASSTSTDLVGQVSWTKFLKKGSITLSRCPPMPMTTSRRSICAGLLKAATRIFPSRTHFRANM